MTQGGGENIYGGKNTREFKDQEYNEYRCCESFKHYGKSSVGRSDSELGAEIFEPGE